MGTAIAGRRRAAGSASPRQGGPDTPSVSADRSIWPSAVRIAFPRAIPLARPRGCGRASPACRCVCTRICGRSTRAADRSGGGCVLALRISPGGGRVSNNGGAPRWWERPAHSHCASIPLPMSTPMSSNASRTSVSEAILPPFESEAGLDSPADGGGVGQVLRCALLQHRTQPTAMPQRNSKKQGSAKKVRQWKA